MATETIEVEGHIVDSLLLPKMLDAILNVGGDYEILDVSIGKTNTDVSRARVEVTAPDAVMEALLEELQVHGANRVSANDAELVVCDMDGVLPPGFYSTTNLPTSIRLNGKWVDVERPEMDCAIVVGEDGTARTVPMHRSKVGDRVVVGNEGVRVRAMSRPRDAGSFEFMTSDASSEKPKGVVTAEIAGRIRKAKERGGKVLVVAGPAVVHTGAGVPLARMVRDGWVDVLFAGNGFATHDIESNVMGTSLGVSVREGSGVESGHSNHLRVINEVRRYGSIANAVEAGYIDGGILYECVRHNVPFVLGGSVRDDGPLPDVYTDVVQAADAMRYMLPGVAVALVLGTTLHGIATGNLLPADVEMISVDINPAVATKLADRGSKQAMGVVTDVGLFVGDLADLLSTK